MLEGSSTTLFLALQHPDEEIRLLAVKKVVAQLIEGNMADEQLEDFVQDALLERLMDESPNVVWQVFQVFDAILDKNEPEALFKQLSSIITSTFDLHLGLLGATVLTWLRGVMFTTGQHSTADVKTRALEILTSSFLKKHPAYMRAVQSILFDSLLAQGRKDNINFFINAINIAAILASEHKGTIFEGIATAAEGVEDFYDKDESEVQRVDNAIKVRLASALCDHIIFRKR
jgi:hypothetical protein